ncbi:hypothetical protein KJ632_05875 [Patescibacteria group bacterium]|nr:hypothetical protein [Patescibacteria group bacterium]
MAEENPGETIPEEESPVQELETRTLDAIRNLDIPKEIKITVRGALRTVFDTFNEEEELKRKQEEIESLKSEINTTLSAEDGYHNISAYEKTFDLVKNYESSAKNLSTLSSLSDALDRHYKYCYKYRDEAEKVIREHLEANPSDKEAKRVLALHLSNIIKNGAPFNSKTLKEEIDAILEETDKETPDQTNLLILTNLGKFDEAMEIIEQEKQKKGEEKSIQELLLLLIEKLIQIIKDLETVKNIADPQKKQNTLRMIKGLSLRQPTDANDHNDLKETIIRENKKFPRKAPKISDLVDLKSIKSINRSLLYITRSLTFKDPMIRMNADEMIQDIERMIKAI